MTIEVAATDWPVGAMAVGLGIWVFFGWCWVTAGVRMRAGAVAAFGLVVASAFVLGAGVSWLQAGPGLSSLGAGAGAVLAVGVGLVARPEPTRRLLDGLVPGGIAGLAVARAGCLFEGCDFGRLADSGLAVVYPADTRAWTVHVGEYGLSATSPTSLAVHPFGAYLAVWGLICAVGGEWLRRRTDSVGRAAVYSATGFVVGGGLIELVREPATVPTLGDGWSVYPLAYWAAAAGLVAWWRGRE